MASLIRYTAFEPLVTGPLLWVLTRGSADLRDRVLRPLASLPFTLDEGTLVKSLKWLFALGLAARINKFLSSWALNNWYLGSSGGKPWVWDQEIAVVTGGSGGIGGELVKRLAQKGMKVVILDLQPPSSSIKSSGKVYFYECDITKHASVTEVANKVKKEVGDATILVNNAGIGRSGTILEVDNDYLEKIMHINLISHWYTVKEFLPGMIKAKKGHIVATASMASYTAVAGMVDYCVSKAGVMSFQEGLTQELKYRYNAPFIKTTSIHPFWVRTALLGKWEESLDRLRNPLMTPQYVAGRIANAIFSGKSGSVNLPDYLAGVSGARGWPHWLHTMVNDTTKEVTREK